MGLQCIIFCSGECMPQLRKEILVRTNEDGQIELYDPLLQVAHQLSHEESVDFRQGVEEWSPELCTRLEDDVLLEGFGAEIIRKNCWNNRLMFRMKPNLLAFPAVDWDIAKNLPDCVQSHWKNGERWRRLYEQGCSGNDIFVLDDLFCTDVLSGYCASISGFTTYSSSVVQADRVVLKDGPVQRLMHDPIFRELCQSLLHVALHTETWIQAWRLKKGEGFQVHADGSKYLGTISVGCSQDWTAVHGGAISFGENTSSGWRSRYRWLPHLGSAILFRPRADLWHGVEEVQKGTRYSITGWWLEKGHHIHQH
jgi:hypothetical protein